MEIWRDYRSEEQAGALKAWTNYMDRLSKRMADDFWAHAGALGRYVDDLARARSLATFEEARRAYGQRAVELFEQSVQGYASLFERPARGDAAVEPTKVSDDPVREGSDPSIMRSHSPSVGGSAEPERAAADAAVEMTDSARAKAAASALLSVVRARAEAQAAEDTKSSAPVPAKRQRVRKTAASNVAKKPASEPTQDRSSKPRKRARRRPPKNVLGPNEGT